MKKKRAVELLLKKVIGPWRQSKFASAISFFQTQVLKSNQCIENLLKDIDNLCFIVATINGTSKDYQRGLNVQVNLQMQGNYICLRELEENITNTQSCKEIADHLKQRSPEWFKLRKKACVTRSTMFRALGFGSLKDQKAHIAKTFGQEEENVSPEL